MYNAISKLPQILIIVFIVAVLFDIALFFPALQSYLRKRRAKK
jgi:hypothetical protein